MIRFLFACIVIDYFALFESTHKYLHVFACYHNIIFFRINFDLLSDLLKVVHIRKETTYPVYHFFIGKCLDMYPFANIDTQMA